MTSLGHIWDGARIISSLFRAFSRLWASAARLPAPLILLPSDGNPSSMLLRSLARLGGGAAGSILGVGARQTGRGANGGPGAQQGGQGAAAAGA